MAGKVELQNFLITHQQYKHVQVLFMPLSGYLMTFFRSFCNLLLCFAISRHSELEFKDILKVSCLPHAKIRGEKIIILKKRNFSERGEAELRGLEVLLFVICQCFSTATPLRPRIGCPINYDYSKKL